MIDPSYSGAIASIGGRASLVLTGNHSLIESSVMPPSPDTLSGDPGLLPLADNGGPTWTHELAADSIAIDAGSNPDSFAFDQRSDGFPCEAGGAADIGAFELQPPQVADDVIFADGFDAAP